MSLIILETGAGLTNSNAYADLAAFKAYCNARNLTLASDLKIEAALIRATDYIDANYVFKSVKNDEDQALENPRYGQGEDLKPQLVKATIELAILIIDNPVFGIATRSTVEEEKELEGVGMSRTVYRENESLDPFPHVTAILRAIASLSGGAGSSRSMSL